MRRKAHEKEGGRTPCAEEVVSARNHIILLLGTAPEEAADLVAVDRALLRSLIRLRGDAVGPAGRWGHVRGERWPKASEMAVAQQQQVGWL
jgi:hypothetical protein